MRVTRIPVQDSYTVKYGEAEVLVNIHGVNYEVPTALPLMSETWRKRHNKVIGRGWKLGRERYCGISEQNFYRLGKQLCKM